MLVSPVNWPGRRTATSVSPVPDGRMISTSPGRDDEEGHDLVAGLDEHLAARTGRTRPCAAMRAICAGVSVGKT